MGRKRRNDVVALLGFFVLAPIGVVDRVGVEKPEILFSIIKDIYQRDRQAQSRFMHVLY